MNGKHVKIRENDKTYMRYMNNVQQWIKSR